MKKWLIIVGVVLAMAMPSLALSEEISPICNKDPEVSQTKFNVTIEGKKIPAPSIRCAYELAFMKHKASFADREKILIEAMDFETGEMFDALKGFFVVDCNVIPRGSTEPYALGFSTLERANKFLHSHEFLGERVVNFESATHIVIDRLRAEGKLPKGAEAPMEQIEIILQEKK